jgi:hypothetical protein
MRRQKRFIQSIIFSLAVCALVLANAFAAAAAECIAREMYAVARPNAGKAASR